MKALDGVKVLDLTHALAGPFCTYQLQLLGAEVTKVERPGKGDDFRDFGRPEGWTVGPSFVAVNGGKRSVTVDLKSPRGIEIVQRLARDADVVVENLRPGAAEALGLGYESLKAENPKLIYCSISGFGPNSPDRDLQGYEAVVAARVGRMNGLGRISGDPHLEILRGIVMQPGPQNVCGLQPGMFPEYDALLVRAESAIDPEEMRDAYYAFQDMLSDINPTLMVAHHAQVEVTRTELREYQLHPWFYYDYRPMWLANG